MNIYVKEIPANNIRFLQNPGDFYSLQAVVDCFNNYTIPGTWGFSIDPTQNHILSGGGRDTELYPLEPRTYARTATFPSTAIDDVNDVINYPWGTLREQNIIMMLSSGNMPDPLNQYQEYFISKYLLDTYHVDALDGSGYIDLTSQGSGNISIYQKWNISVYELLQFNIIDSDGANKTYTNYGFRCDSKANYLADMKQYILNVAANSLDWWKSATILFAHIQHAGGSDYGTQVDAYVSFVYHGNDGVLV